MGKAIYYAFTGEADAMFDALERAYQRRDHMTLYMECYDPYRDDPRFQDLLRADWRRQAGSVEARPALRAAAGHLLNMSSRFSSVSMTDIAVNSPIADGCQANGMPGSAR